MWPLDFSEPHRVNSHALLCFGAMPSRDLDVKSALDLARVTIPAAPRVPFLSIPALAECTPSYITEGDLME